MLEALWEIEQDCPLCTEMELDPFIADIKRGLFEALNAQIDDYSVETDMGID